MRESEDRAPSDNNTQTMLTKAGEDQYLTFLLGGEEYGVDILRIQEIRGWEGATGIPNTPEYVLGVINLRGLVVPVLDLRKRFNLPKADFDAATVIVVVNVVHDNDDRVMGIVVDGVSDVYNFSVDKINEAPDLGMSISTEVVKGFAMVEEKMIIILDIDQLISLGLLDEIELTETEITSQEGAELAGSD